MKHYDALIIGGGFFGCMIAIALRQQGLARVVVAERSNQIMRRATQFNQARIHRGYHYPRDSVTARASARGYHRFIDDFRTASRPDFITHYGIARNSKVTPSQFEHFCKSVGIPLSAPSLSMRRLVDSDLVQEVYQVEECVFDCNRLMQDVRQRLQQAGVEVRLETEVSGVSSKGAKHYFQLNNEQASADFVFNATYAEIDRQGIAVRSKVKREWVEVALIKPPPDLADSGITIMDGPFFSVMPFPSRDCYSLTHVRYTPIASWIDNKDAPAMGAFGIHKSIQASAMQYDAMRYIPCMRQAEILGSYYEIKAVLAATDHSDARPVLFEKSDDFPAVYSVLGSKIDNIYDVLEELPEIVNRSSAVIPYYEGSR
ncbi:MAG: FAD-binding oxidoreductase [Alphaproteobacteria bacterium]|nr:FAD-binding oxidoreductase [Alphaproteobacteria bacterium]